MRTKEKILEQVMDNLDVDKIVILEAMLDIRDTFVEIEKRLTEIGGQVEDIGGEARMNTRIKNR